MRLGRYRGRHLRRRPKRRGPVVVGTAATVWLSGSSAQAATYIVRSGDTLSAIARRHRVSVSELERTNGISNPDVIYEGTRLRVPDPPPSGYVVRSGDTLSSIAARFETSVRLLARTNHLADADLILAGRRLRVPGSAAYKTVVAPISQDEIEESLESQAAAHGVDHALVKAVAWQESGWRQDVLSRAGAIGVMQVMPETARFVNGVLGGGNLDLHKGDDNVHLGVMYLHHMLATMPSESKALAGYYSGPGSVGRRLKKYQRPYVRAVKALKRRF
jgi:N-acetylmuramoyl-L-alanine amidase